VRIDLTSLYLALEARQPVTIAGAAGTVVRVLEGRVWLTEEGVSEDLFLFPGSEYRLQSFGRVVLDSDGVSRVEVATPVSVRSGPPTLGEFLSRGASWIRQHVRPVAGARGQSSLGDRPWPQ